MSHGDVDASGLHLQTSTSTPTPTETDSASSTAEASTAAAARNVLGYGMAVLPIGLVLWQPDTDQSWCEAGHLTPRTLVRAQGGGDEQCTVLVSRYGVIADYTKRFIVCRSWAASGLSKLIPLVSVSRAYTGSFVEYFRWAML